MSHDPDQHENGHDHQHEHAHDHAGGPVQEHRSPPRPDLPDTLTYYRAMEAAVRELLIEKGIFTADDVRSQVEFMDGRNAGRGAKMVARAWLDPAYKQRVLADGSRAAGEIGLDVGMLKLVVVENTQAVHNVIVCTLCSCYPRSLLGLPKQELLDRRLEKYLKMGVYLEEAVVAAAPEDVAPDSTPASARNSPAPAGVASPPPRSMSRPSPAYPESARSHRQT